MSHKTQHDYDFKERLKSLFHSKRAKILLSVLLILTLLRATAKTEVVEIGLLSTGFGKTCGIPEGCGPSNRLYFLWNCTTYGMGEYIPLTGLVNPFYDGLIVQMRQTKVLGMLNITTYKRLSKIPYDDYPMTESAKYMQEHYGCVFNHNKNFCWDYRGGVPIIKTRWTIFPSDAKPEPYVEVWYNGNSGDFIREVNTLGNWDPCTYKLINGTTRVELRGEILHIGTFPEAPSPPSWVILRTKGGDIYLDGDHGYYHTFVFVTGQLDQQNVVHVESIGLDTENPYTSDKHYCDESVECYGSVNGEDKCEVTECVNEYNAWLNINRTCMYYDSDSYAQVGGRCQCLNHTCNARPIISYLEVAKARCKEMNLTECSDANFHEFSCMLGGDSIVVWKKYGFNCSLSRRVCGGLHVYFYDGSNCNSSNCIIPAGDKFFLISDKDQHIVVWQNEKTASFCQEKGVS